MLLKTCLTVSLSLLLMLFYSTSTAQLSKAAKGRIFENQPRSKGNSRDPIQRPSKVHPPYRSYDGTDNNILNSQTYDWGSADIPLYRELPAAYGAQDPKNAMAGATRPSARKISNAVCDEPVTTFNARGVSTFFYVWGQFIDHDMSLTPTDTTEYVPIVLPPDETIFTLDIPFTRSEVRAGTGKTVPRQQTNLNTSWIDASQVYGSDGTRAKWLRSFKNGKLRTSAGNLMPYNTVTGELGASIDPHAPDMANDSDKTVKTFVAGDIRASEHPGLISLHTIFLREHNRICDRLYAQGLRNDEDMYQRARKEVGALIQAITFQEFLPAFGVNVHPYRGYSASVRPDIANTFATAAYRFGHSVVADDIIILDKNCDSIPPNVIELLDAFWTPQLVPKYGIEPFLRGFAAHTQYETDTKINSVLRNFLFVSPNDPVRFGIDLAALNIQRGRDHGLPDYNTLRRYYTGKGANNFRDITTNAALASSLQSLYGNVNNIDPWIGVLAEDHLPNTSAGNTLLEMLRSQFERLRDGDFYFYLNDPYLPPAVLSTLKKTRFSDVIKRNSTITRLPDNVFFQADCSEDLLATNNAEAETAIKPVNEGVKIYPNPATNSVSIDLGTTMSDQTGTIEIYNAGGALVKNAPLLSGQQTTQVSIADLKPGLYFVNVVSGQSIQSFKVIKLAH